MGSLRLTDDERARLIEAVQILVVVIMTVLGRAFVQRIAAPSDANRDGDASDDAQAPARVVPYNPTAVGRTAGGSTMPLAKGEEQQDQPRAELPRLGLPPLGRGAS